ncbi:MAG: YcgL domain-containing protein [Pseudomonadales bacterium]|nr:YcgL domain-containing protein [Pseudomonadales bacterium]
MALLCEVYKSDKHPEVYIYVPKDKGLQNLPEDLRAKFGEPELALTFELTEHRRLAKEDSQEVLKNLQSQGYHLQMPPLKLGQLGLAD